MIKEICKRQFPPAFLLAFLLAASGYAQHSPISYKSEAAVQMSQKARGRLENRRQSDNYKSVHVMEFDFSMLNEQNITVAMPDGEALTVSRTPQKTGTHRDGRTWTGTYKDNETEVIAVFSADADDRHVYGSIITYKTTPKGIVYRNFGIESLDDNVFILAELDWAKNPGRCAME